MYHIYVMNLRIPCLTLAEIAVNYTNEYFLVEVNLQQVISPSEQMLTLGWMDWSKCRQTQRKYHGKEGFTLNTTMIVNMSTRH